MTKKTVGSTDEYSGMTDICLIEAAKDGNTAALEALMDRYKGMVKNKARSYFLFGGDYDDIIQEGMIGLYYAFRNYDTSKEAAFKTFADLCITRRIISAVRSSGNSAKNPLNDYVSLDYSDEGYAPEIAYMEAKDGRPDEDMIRREETEMLDRIIENRLSNKEKEVLKIFLAGYKYDEIAAKLNIKVKSVDNALSRIKKKIGGAKDENIF